MPLDTAITRRGALGALGLGLGAAAGLVPARALAAITCPNACRSMIGPDEAWIRALPVIDAHCHIFNARDIPAVRFITGVFLPGYAVHLTPSQRRQLEANISAALAGTLTYTPGFAQERAVLEARLAGEAEPEALARQGPLPKFARGARNSCYGRDVADNIAAVRNLVSILSGFRHKSFEALARTYQSALPGVGVALFTPAMVDMDYWLGAFRDRATDISDTGTGAGELPETTPAQQVELMELIQRLHAGHLHGFVSFCPWRQADDLAHNAAVGELSPRRRATALETVEDAILNRGFLGVKLYPPMGFLPLGNAELPVDAFPPWAAREPYADRFGAALDEALISLYRFCAEHEVPLMVHAAPTNGAGAYRGASYGARADPEGWARVLALPGLRALRLNLAHFGAGFDAGETLRWRITIGALMDAHPHVYADLSHFPEMVLDNFTGSGQHCREAAELLEGLRKGFLAGAGGARARRLLYGSDWSMLSKEFYYADYLAVVAHMYRRKIYGVGEGAEKNARGFMCANAVRYLGLRRGEAARARLEAWYARHGLDAGALARFDGVGA